MFGGFGNRLTLHRTPAWHGKGFVTMDPLTAEEAVMAGNMDYDVDRRPLYVPAPAGDSYLLIPEYRALYRGAHGTDPETILGVVSTEFNTFNGPLEVARLCDSVIDHHIETVGSLGKGELFFITWELPRSAVAGDEHQNYLMADINFAGGDSCYARNTKTRVVCINTYAFARQDSTQTVRLNHKGDIRKQLADGLALIWDGALIRSQEQDEALTLLAGKRMEQEPFTEMLVEVYPEPKAPVQREKEDSRDFAFRKKRWEASLNRCLIRRNAVRALFAGDRPAKAPEAFTPACRGTMYGALNAITEEIDWNSPATDSPRTARISEVNGEKATLKAKAAAFLLELAGAKV